MSQISRLPLIGYLLDLCLAFFAGHTYADWPPDSPGPKLPFAIHWNIGFKGATLNEEIEIKEHRYYQFSLAFRYADQRSNKENLKKLFEYVGDGSYHRVTKESAGTDNPVIVPEYTEDEKEFIKRGDSLVGGTFYKNHPMKSNERLHESPPNTVLVLSKAGRGTIIPIYIKIEKIDSPNQLPPIIDQVFKTYGVYGFGQYGRMRQIVQVSLNQGRYRITASSQDDVILPEGVETIFVGTWDSRLKALSN